MATKNLVNRAAVLCTAYRLFGEMDYDKVSLSDIAKGAGISKSLLQHYFQQKKTIVSTMLSELLNTSYSYMKGTEGSTFQKLSDFNHLFFKAAGYDQKLDHFIVVSIGHAELLDTWIELLCTWLRSLCGEETFSYLDLRTAFCFSMGGSMHLYQHKDELGIDYRFITELHVRTLLSMLSVPQTEIEKICSQTSARSVQMDIGDFLAYCKSNISWLE